MAFKFVALFALVAVASAQYVDYSHGHGVQSPVFHTAPVLKTIHHEVEAPAKYDFEYSVHDTQTGDIKQQHESRDGDRVQGQYSLVDADGLHRIVDYTADDVNGFQATVRREPITKPLEPIHHVAHVAPVVHKVVAAAPVHHYAPAVYQHAAPVVYQHAAPVVYQHAAPVAHVVAHAPAPVVYQHASPVAHVVSHAAPVAQYSHNAGHVSFNTVGSNYHY